ncbi:MAG TPA: rhomboid family intramembrane serine protease [Flavobacteriales bacterium]|jgi:membrane associated rhomboid family serine protease|nr:rhomboid family intramembrane serine protease [Flavobacteriales bacterium]HIL66410.1 rhomboid family intramembrane serine protease [Flavobacteriales bacterium]
MSSVFEDIKNNFKGGNSLTKLIYINVGVFLIASVLRVLSFLFMVNGWEFLSYFTLPASIPLLIKKPWSIISYMFLHQSFIHLLFNMLWLYFGGQIFLSFFDNKKLISTYVLGGISGAVLFILSFNLFPVFATALPNAVALGASASVLAIIMAIATKSPNYSIRLLLIGNIKLKHIAIVSIVLDIMSIPQGNAGGHIAHLGGAFFGYLYVKQLNSGNDIANSFNKIMDNLNSYLKKDPKLKKAYSRKKSDQDYRKEKVQNQAKIDNILDKIAKSGYEGLTKEEKDILFKASKK